MVLNFLGFLNISFADILDIAVVALMIYLSFKWLKGSSAMNIFLAIVLLLVIRVVAVALNMKMLSSLLGTVIDVGAIALVVIFQPEIRRFLNRLGRRTGFNGGGSLIDRILRRPEDRLHNEAIQHLDQACQDMSDQKTGALIVIRHKDSLQDIIETGDMIDADIRQRLIENIFFKNSPLHDGAMIIGGGRIIAARCTLPITQRTDIPARYGMRHKAAIGISEMTDADVIVVSEQTGVISFVREGKITAVKGRNNLAVILAGSSEKEKKEEVETE